MSAIPAMLYVIYVFYVIYVSYVIYVLVVIYVLHVIYVLKDVIHVNCNMQRCGRVVSAPYFPEQWGSWRAL